MQRSRRLSNNLAIWCRAIVAAAVLGLLAGPAAAGTPLWVSTLDGDTVLAVERPTPRTAETADALEPTPGVQLLRAAGGSLLLVESVGLTGDTPTADDNDYTRIDVALQAVGALGNGTSVRLVGTFDWTEVNAAASWAAQQYGLNAPVGIADVWFGAQSLGDAVILGPGDLPDQGFEGFLFMYGGTFHGWTIENLEIRGFDWAIGMFYQGTADFAGVTVANNRIVMPADLNGTAGVDESYQNVALHLGPGSDQTIRDNEIVLPGNGLSDTSEPTAVTYAATVALQSSTHGGASYHGLQIIDNLVRITGAQSADPEVVFGFWENGHAHGSDILVARNRFLNEDSANDPMVNLQRAFRVTSHSSLTTTVTYEDNTVVGAARAIGWIGGGYISDPPSTVEPVAVTGNTLLDNGIGVWVHSDGVDPTSKATLVANRIVGNTTGLLVENAQVTAENNWWGCNDGPSGTGCDAATFTGGGFLVADPWLVLDLAAPAVVEVGSDVSLLASLQGNSDGVDLGPIPFAAVSIALDADAGAVVSPADTLEGAATSTYTGVVQGLDTIQAALDNAVATTSILVTEGGAVTVRSISETADTPTLADNDYTRINDLVQALASGVTLELEGTFDWTEPFAELAWSYGSDGIDGTGDDWTLLAPVGLENVTLRSAAPGGAVIQGPGDLPGIDLEGFLGMWGGTYHGWTVQGLDIRGFDLGIGMFYNGAHDFDGVSILDNRIELPADHNAHAAPADAYQNIAIHLAFGTNQTLQGNEIVFAGTGMSDSGGTTPVWAASIGIQSNTGGGSTYDGLVIADNTFRVLGAQRTDPEVVNGFWENAHGHASNITVSGNTFINEHPDNDAALNLQRAFRVTSHSSDTTTVLYTGNTISGANIGIDWYPSTPPASVGPVIVSGNDLTDCGTAVQVRSSTGDATARANLRLNRIVGNGAGLVVDNAHAVAEDNWWGCNAGPGALGCDSATLTGAGSLDADPWLVLNLAPATVMVPIAGTTMLTADVTTNSDGQPVIADVFPAAPVAFAATDGSVSPELTVLTAGSATSTFSAPASPGEVDITATVDGETALSVVTVTAEADLSADLTPAEQMVAPGDPVALVAQFGNAGPASAGAVVSVELSADLTGATWTCVAAGGASCTAAGSGAIDDNVVLPVGGTVTYTISAMLAADFGGRATALAEITPTAPSVDSSTVNNIASATVTSTWIFSDGFEQGNVSGWSDSVGLTP